jgi:hypothetical protein
MGVTLPVLRLLARIHKANPVRGPILTLGRQAIYATYAEVCALLESEGITRHPVPAGISLTTNIPEWKTGPNAGFTNDRVVFQMLTGAEVLALDVSSYEDADYVADLNKPLPGDLLGKFGLVLDAGTLEHVFDVRQALINVNGLARVGGRVFHSSPANSWMQHGFYQLSPTLFYDYYGVNLFEHPECYLIEMTKECMEKSYGLPSGCWKWNEERPYAQLFSEHALTLVFSAVKTDRATHDQIPQQGDFLKVGMGGRLGGPGPVAERTLLQRAGARLPWRIKHAIKRALGQDITVKPWGLEYLGKI